MYQTLIQRYENGCQMLMDQREDGYHFLGASFIVHPNGYLLTAPHLLKEAKSPVVVHSAQPGVFTPLAVDNASTLPVRPVQIDESRGVALLKMEMEEVIAAPDDFLGSVKTVYEGTHCLTFGVPFGHFRIHNIMVMRAMVSAKLISPNGTNLLAFDTLIHPGDVGGPLVSTDDGRIIGVIQGPFNPMEIQQVEQPPDYHLPSNFSYAVSIEYAEPLLRAEGLLTV